MKLVSIVNVEFFSAVVLEAAVQLKVTELQLGAVELLERLVHGPANTFASLSVDMTEDILVIHVEEVAGDLQVVHGGLWFKLAIEPDGYCVLTTSKSKVPVTYDPFGE